MGQLKTVFPPIEKIEIKFLIDSSQNPTKTLRILNDDCFYNWEQRSLEALKLNDDEVDTFYGCTGCRYYCPNHACIISPNNYDRVRECDIWITAPPYADAINYHELSEFFLAWYEKHLTNVIKDWNKKQHDIIIFCDPYWEQYDEEQFQDKIDFLEAKLSETPKIIEHIIETQSEKILNIAKKYKDAECFYFLGRGISTATAYEARLKLLEIAYIPSIAYPAGESKHGPISLVQSGFPVVFICPSDNTRKILLGNIMEMKARGARIIAVIDSNDNEIMNLADDYITIPPGIPGVLSPISYVIPLQLLAYYMAVERGLNPDMPRNLAKSVTVL